MAIREEWGEVAFAVLADPSEAASVDFEQPEDSDYDGQSERRDRHLPP